MRGCTAGFFAVGQRSSLSRRPTVVEDCAFALPAGSVLHQTPVTNPVHFVRTRITGVDGTILRGAGPVTFTDCELVGGTDDAPAAPVDLGSADVTVTGGSWQGVGVRLSGARDQRLVLDGVRAAGTTTAGALVSRGTGAGAVDVTLRGADLRTADGTAHVALRPGDRYAATGSRFTGGRLDLPDGVRVLHARNVETGVDRAGLPTAGDGVLVDANLTV